MKLTDILLAIPKGGIVKNKRVLAALKRASLIFGYSKWGYLESQNVHYMSGDDVSHQFTYAGPAINDGDKGSRYKPFESFEARGDAGYFLSLDFWYKGHRFVTKYLDGCFNAYLQKIDGPTKSSETLNPKMSVWGSIAYGELR